MAQTRSGSRHETSVRVLLSGAYGNGNFGDWAILESLLNSLGDMPNIEAAVLTSGRVKLPGHIQARTFSSAGFLSRLRALLWARVVVFGGGGLVKEDPQSPLNLPLRLVLDLLLPSLLSRQTIVYSIGVDKIRTKWGNYYTRRLIPLASPIVVRDGASQKNLESAGVRPSEITLGADAAMSGFLSEIQSKEAESKRRASIGVNLCLWGNAMSEEADRQKFDRFLDTAAAALSRLAEENGASITGVICCTNTLADDRISLERFQAKLSTDVAFGLVDASQYSMADMAALLQSFDLFIGTRLHSVIAAGLAKVPVLTVSYASKVKELAHEIDMDDFCYDLEHESVEEFAAKLDAAWESRRSLTTQTHEPLEEIFERHRRAEEILRIELARVASRPTSLLAGWSKRIPLGVQLLRFAATFGASKLGRSRARKGDNK